MKKKLTEQSLFLIAFFSFFCFSCEIKEPPKTDDVFENKELTKGELLTRGKYLVTVMGCNDCHSAKKMTPQGPIIDSTKMLSGYPQSLRLPPFDKNALKPGNWILFLPDLTAAVGPWGVSFAANLTPDSVSGIGAWEDHVFIATLRTGKHLGHDNGRPIMPPMPWENFAHLTDIDLKAIFHYLKSLPPISNKVPTNIPPDEVAKMK